MLTSRQRTRIQVIAVIGSMIALIPVCLTLRLEALSGYYLLETNESRYYLTDEQWLVPMSLGYREAAAGMVWARTLVYFGEQREVRGRFDYLEQYLLGVTTLDPYFYRAYTWGSNAAMYKGNLIDREAVDMSIRMLERGLQVYPEDGDLHYFLGFQYYFELPSFVDDEEEQRRYRRIGMDEICTAALLGGGPAYLPSLCSGLMDRLGMDQIALDRIVALLVETEDEATRARLEARLEELATRDGAFTITHRITDQRQRWQRERPYLPLGFYTLIGSAEVLPRRDQVELPLPMDRMIRAAEEELWYQADEEEESSEGDDAPLDLSLDEDEPQESREPAGEVEQL
jgi:hypothetical protein